MSNNDFISQDHFDLSVEEIEHQTHQNPSTMHQTPPIPPPVQWSNPFPQHGQHQLLPQHAAQQAALQGPQLLQPQRQYQQYPADTTNIQVHQMNNGSQGYPQGIAYAQPPQHLPPQTQQLSSTQKKRRTQQSKDVPRKRTLMACESCRIRKVKCDLSRPVCGSCEKSRVSCVYRNLKGNIDDMTRMAGLNGKNNPPRWYSCNWYSKGEGILKWPIFEKRYRIRAINSVLSAKSRDGIPQLGMFTTQELLELSDNLKENLSDYADSFLKNVSNKDPFINTKTLLRTVDYFKKQASLSSNLYLFDMEIPDELLPPPVLIECCAIGLMSKPLTFRNLVDYKTSSNEKSDVATQAYKFHIVANLVNAVPKTKIPDFSLGNVQHYLLQCMFWNYNMKPLKAWDSVFKASTTVMTILESYKSSGRKFTESEHRIVERVFFSCLKYESELRVELSPSIPSSGIVNYPFPSIYPTPPLDGTLSPTDEASWFFYLTEIVLRKLENRLLDEFYEPLASATDSSSATGEFAEDIYSLDWGKYDIATVISKISEYLEDLSKIEKNMITHLKPVLQDDQAELQPHGFVMKPVTSTYQPLAPQTPVHLNNSQSTLEERIPPTPSSDTSSSNISQRAEQVAPRVPEVINWIKTRMIAFKILLFRPLAYLILHDTVPNYDNPFIDQFIQQVVETMDLLNLPLATHRHFGSWFYARNTFIAGMMIFAFFIRFGEKFASKSKCEEFLKQVSMVLDYWVDEAGDLEEPRRVIADMLGELRHM
ncbi:Sterol uptake control protein 2 [Cyberlindnera fabianii]|uniref:Sterol uptake control protein 2 n=1 Tax=Cyberlindnera fabianii TaxID=36022 RepID=A0A1V2LF44_CYBFA|nr:Sterol uptake control protein 2 [Cyberlindnera fabianii]